MAGAFTAAGQALIADLTKGLERGAVEVMAGADYLVPKDTMTLVGSHRIFHPVNDSLTVSVTFGYGFGGARNPKTGNPVDEYAVPVHEILEAKHAPPTQAKFLEGPLFEYAGRMETDLAAELRITWGKRI